MEEKESIKDVSETKITRTEFADGGYEEIRVEKVEGGYIKTICSRTKIGDEWVYNDRRSVSVEDPNKDKTPLIEKFSEMFKGLE